MNPKDQGLVWCYVDGNMVLRYFIESRFEPRQVIDPVTAKRKKIEVLIVTTPGGEEILIKDRAVRVSETQLHLFRAADAIYRYPKEV